MFVFLLLHEIFHHYFHKRRPDFVDKLLGCNPEHINTFLSGIVERNDPRIKQHPMVVEHPEWFRRGAPLSFQGGAVLCLAVGKSGAESLDVTSWQSVLAVGGSSLDLKFFVSAMSQNNKLKRSAGDEYGTYTEIGETLFWSCNSLLKGKRPDRDHKGELYGALSAEGLLAGSDLADGHFGVVWLIISDLDHVAKYLHCRHYMSNQPCDHCPCRANGPPRIPR